MSAGRTRTPPPTRRSRRRARQALLTLLADVPDSPLKQAAIATIEAAYTATVGPGPYDAATQAGLDTGAAAAAAIVALRAGDGSATPHLPYTLSPGPGVYQPTPNPEFPAVITPSFAGWAHVTPFALRTTLSSRCRPAPSSTSRAGAMPANTTR